MRVRILGKYWTLAYEALRRSRIEGHYIDGLTNADSRTIHIDSRLRGQRELETIVHEFLHACDQCSDRRVPFVHSEDYVTAKANDLAKLLWRLGYRRNANAENSGTTDSGETV